MTIRDSSAATNPSFDFYLGIELEICKTPCLASDQRALSPVTKCEDLSLNGEDMLDADADP